MGLQSLGCISPCNKILGEGSLCRALFCLSVIICQYRIYFKSTSAPATQHAVRCLQSHPGTAGGAVRYQQSRRLRSPSCCIAERATLVLQDVLSGVYRATLLLQNMLSGFNMVRLQNVDDIINFKLQTCIHVICSSLFIVVTTEGYIHYLTPWGAHQIVTCIWNAGQIFH